MRKPPKVEIPDPIPPATPPTLAQARNPAPTRQSLIPPNIRTSARGVLAPAQTQKRSLIGGSM